MSLSFRITSTFASSDTPALFIASNAMPAVIAPSPITAIEKRSSPFSWLPIAMPSAAEIDVLECAVPNVSYSDSLRRGKPEMPSCWRSECIWSRRPVRILCG